MATSNKTARKAARKAKAAAPATPAPTANVATPQAQQQHLAVSAAGAKYSPRTTTMQGNAASWQATQQYIAANGGKVTLAALQAHLAQARNHANFAKYALRRGWLQPAK